MHNFKKAGKVILAAAFVVCLLLVLDAVLYPCTFIRNDIHAVTTQTFDDVYLGTSHGKMNIDPSAMEEVTGRTGHNLCVGGEYSIDTYYLAKLMLETGHKPERIVYEVSPGYFTMEKEEGNNYLLFYHEFPLTKAKLAYFADAVAKCNFRTLFFPWYEYPLSYELKNLKDTVSRKWNRDYSGESMKTDAQEYHEDGFINRYPVDPTTFSFAGMSEPDTAKIVPVNMEYLSRLITLCKDNDIEFVAMVTPLPAATLKQFSAGIEAMWVYFNEFFEKEGVPFLNFNDMEHYQLVSHKVENFTDLDGHMHGEAASAFSRVLAEQLELL